MEIIKSKYSAQELKNFKQKEEEKIGEKNIIFIQIINILNFGIIMLFLGLSLAFTISEAINFTTTENRISWLLLIFLYIGFFMSIIFCGNMGGLPIITLGLMNLKKIPYSPILTENLDAIINQHEKLLEIEEIVGKYESNYIINQSTDSIFGTLDISYKDDKGNFKIEHYQFLKDNLNLLIKDGILNCAYLDERIEKILNNSNTNKETLNV